jgi:hypothetical protein
MIISFVIQFTPEGEQSGSLSAFVINRNQDEAARLATRGHSSPVGDDG